MLRNGHVRFGGRAAETHQPQDWQGAAARPLHLRADLGRVLLCRFIVDVYAQLIVAWHAATGRPPAGDDTATDGAVAARPRRPPGPARGADPSLRRRQPIHLYPVQRASSAGRHPTLHRQHRRCVRPDGDDHRPIQDRMHPHRRLPRPAYKTLADVEYATAGWVDWYNNRRLHGSIGMVPPAEHEQAHYAALKPEMQPV